MAERVAGMIILTVVVVLAALYTIPAVGGYEIDCGPLERDTCEAAWQGVKHEPMESLGFLTFVPITGVTVRDTSNDAPSCGTWTIHRFGILDVTMHRDCL